MDFDDYVLSELDEHAENIVGSLIGRGLDEILYWDAEDIHHLNMELLRRLHHKLFDPPVYDPMTYHIASDINVGDEADGSLICRFHRDCDRVGWDRHIYAFPYGPTFGYTPQAVFSAFFNFMQDQNVIEIGRAYQDELIRFKGFMVGMKVGAQHDDVKTKTSSGAARPVPRRIKVWSREKPASPQKDRSG